MKKQLPFFILIIQLFLFQHIEAQQKQAALASEVISDISVIAQKADEYVTIIDNAFTTVENSDAFKTLVDGKSVTFPFGILPDDGDKKYALIVNNVKMDAVKGMTVELYMKIPFREDESLYFLADAVPLSKDGKLSGDFKLFLLKTTSLHIGDGYDLTFNGMGKGSFDSTYVTINCRGFVDVTLNGSLNFDPETIEQYDESGESSGEPYSLKFYVTADKLTNFILQFRDIPSFQFKSLPGFKCTVPEITLDQHDLKNAPDFSLPSWYLTATADRFGSDAATQELSTSDLWQGCYIPNISIEIPKSFTEGSDKGVLVVTAEDFIVDQFGITALISALGKGEDHLISGNLKGFEYSLDTVQVGIVESTITSAAVAGAIVFPICKKESTLDYKIQIIQDPTTKDVSYNGHLELDIEGGLEVQALSLATLQLDGGTLDFEYKNKQFYPIVVIDGTIDIGIAKEGSTSSLGDLGFEFGQLVIKSESPYISLGNSPPFDISNLEGDIKDALQNKVTEAVDAAKAEAKAAFFRLKTGAESKMSGLPISISSVELVSKDGGQKLGFGMVMNISLQKSGGSDSESSGGFSGEAGFTIWTARDLSTKKWKYDSFTLNSIVIDVDQESFSLYGQLKRFDEDATYGTGFCGYIKLEVIDKITVEVAGIFGKFDGTRYWFVDASASFPGIPVFTGIELNSFTGGVYHHMRMEKPVSPIAGALEKDQAEGQLCKTASGRTYVPDNTIFLGLLAGVGVQSTGGGTAFNGEINFGIEFNVGGGVRQIATWGGVTFMNFDFEAPDVSSVAGKMDGAGLSDETKEKNDGPPPADAEEESSSLSADWFVSYNFLTKELYGDFNIYVNIVDVIKGGGQNNLAGNISLFAAPSTWYVYIGQPIEGKMVSLEVIDIIDISGYFCIGSQLPDPPMAAMPPEIKPSVNIDYSLLQAGSGLSFGARLSIEGNPGLPLGICRARVELRYMIAVGFDVLISQSKKPVYCSEKYPVRGIHNWYATGQAYIYGEAGLGVSYDCWVGSGFKSIFSLYLSAFVFMQMPKPTYFVGEVSVGFSFFAWDFTKTFTMEKGNTCSSETLENNVLFIEAVSPGDSTVDVNVNEQIVVFFKNPLETFRYKIQGAENSVDEYRTVLQNFDSDPVGSGIIVTQNGNPIDFTWEMSKDNRQLFITPVKLYPEKTEINVSITLVTQYDNNGTWENTGATETKNTMFVTKEEPATLFVKDVLFAYPLPDMKNFYKEESTQGYINLAVIPTKPVQMPDVNYEFTIGIYYYNEEIDRVRGVAFDGVSKFSYAIPKTRLENDKTYTLKLMKSPLQTFTNETSTVDEVNNSEIGKVDDGRKDITILEYSFTTSKYNSFSDKMAMYSTSFSEVFDGVSAAKLSLNTSKTAGVKVEALAETETNGYYVNGSQYADKLIKFGNLNSGNTIVDNISGITDINLQDKGDGSFTTIINVVDAINNTLKDVNLKCLLEGGCSADQLNKIKIPKGEFLIPIEYTLPGKEIVTSRFNISVDLDQEIILPR